MTVDNNENASKNSQNIDHVCKTYLMRLQNLIHIIWEHVLKSSVKNDKFKKKCVLEYKLLLPTVGKELR